MRWLVPGLWDRHYENLRNREADRRNGLVARVLQGIPNGSVVDWFRPTCILSQLNPEFGFEEAGAERVPCRIWRGWCKRKT
jgi:hypothetical protein